MIALLDDAATRAAGAAIAHHVQAGDAIALVGDLGAGKTTLVSGLVAELAGPPVSSPTFSLVNEYATRRFAIWHVDLYRLEREAELRELGLDDIVGNRLGFCVIEWADNFAVMPPDHLRLELAHIDAGRSLVATGTGPRGRAFASAVVDELLGSKP
ncbi:MAG: tRNA (adenosine(37)-N6)-threonylcarbamoyltransferase complex ATPase subunit type 1 TsaE [Kofleriaceae bacterium]